MTTKKAIQPVTTWSTDANYPAGTDPWSATPTKVTPPAGVQTGGVLPNVQLSAQRFNWLVNGIEISLEVLSHAALNSWSHTQGTVPASADVLQFLVPVYPPGVVGAQQNRQQVIAAIGNKNSTSHALLGLSVDGLGFSGGAAFDLGFADFSAIATDPFGVLFGGLTGVATCKSVNYDSTPTTATFTPGNTTQVQAAHYSVGHYIIAPVGAVIYSATALLGTWTATSYGSSGDTVQQIVDNGQPVSGVTRVILTQTAASNSHARVFVSSDDGVTWTLAQDFGVAVLSACYSAQLDKFIVIDGTNGLVWTSTDGATWTSGHAAPLVAAGAAQLAACGNVIAHVVNRTPVAGRYLRGVAYTFDLGATWQEAYFGDHLFGSEPILGVVTANGRLFAFDEFNVYRSGTLESPFVLYTG